MNNLVTFQVTATPEAALKKLAKAEIAVYKLKKNGSRLSFSVNSQYVEKVFAIFSHACYNTVISRQSSRTRLKNFLTTRFCLIAGAVLFTAAAIASGNMVLRIKVVGSGSYLSDRIIAVANECGVKEWSFCRNLDAPLLQAKVMALPSVNFCSVQREGAYLIIDVRAEEEHSSKLDYKPLKSDVGGEVLSIVTVCGTAERAPGEKVRAGDVLIGAYELDENGEGHECVAVGFAEICAQASISLFYSSESEENAQSALKAAALYSDRITEQSYKVSPCDGGVKYEVTFTYIKTFSINME